MGSMSTELEVFETDVRTSVLEPCSALSRPHTSLRSGVVSADFSASSQGTALPFAGLVDAIGVDVAPRTRKGGTSGTTTWSPPV